LKSCQYLYEMDSLHHLFTEEELTAIKKYIQVQSDRLKFLINSGNMNTAMIVSKENDVELFGAHSQVVKKRNEAIEFWHEKQKELE